MWGTTPAQGPAGAHNGPLPGKPLSQQGARTIADIASQALSNQQQVAEAPLSQKGPGVPQGMPSSHHPKPQQQPPQATIARQQQEALQQQQVAQQQAARQQQTAYQQQQEALQWRQPNQYQQPQPLADVGPGHVTNMPAQHSGQIPSHQKATDNKQKLKELENQQAREKIEQQRHQQLAEAEIERKRMYQRTPSYNRSYVQPDQCGPGRRGRSFTHESSRSRSRSPEYRSNRGVRSFFGLLCLVAVCAFCIFAFHH